MNNVWKWVIGVVVLLLAAVLAGTWYLSRHWRPLLDAKIKEAVRRSTDSLYAVGYDELDFNLLTGSATIRNLSLTVDTGRYATLEQRMLAPDNVYNIRVGRLRIRNFHPRRLLSDKQLRIDEILIDTPSVQVIHTYHAYNDTVTSPRDSRTLYQRIGHLLREVSVGNLNLKDVRFRYTNRTDSAIRETELNNLDIDIRDILIDSLSQFDTTRFYHTRSIDVALPGFRYDTPDSVYYISFDRLQVATGSKQIAVQGVRYAPRISKAEFYSRVRQARDLADLTFPLIRLEGVDFFRFARNGQLRAVSLHLDSGTVAISNDLRYPKRMTDKVGRSPHQQLLKLKQPVYFDSVVVNGVDVSYAEVGRKYGKEGKVTFDRVTGVFRNVTNDTLALSRNRHMDAEMTARPMGSGTLRVAFSFDMLDPKGGYTYRGKLDPMDGRPFNRIVTPLLNAEIASAHIRGLTFDVSADDLRARGTLRFDYDNMRLNLLGAADQQKRTKRVVSFLANSFIINDSNPDANGKYHVGRINYVRPRTYSFFKMMWQSLAQGIKECAGISPERERRLMNVAEDAKTASEKTDRFFKRVFRGEK